MVNIEENPERALALSYAPAGVRDGLMALFALNDRLRGIVRAARDPTVGLMRLTWWGDALVRLDAAPPPAEPLLQALATMTFPHGVTGAELESTADGWARLLEPEEISLELFRQEVGETLFVAASKILEAWDERVVAIGRAWALAELVRERPDLLSIARLSLGTSIQGVYRQPWPRRLRPLGALGLIARFDLQGGTAPGSPRRVARLALHRLTGR